jgi:hypothetical protein
MKRNGWIGLCLFVFIGLLVSAILMGCEGAADTVGLGIEPSFVDLTSSSNTATTGTQTFSVTTGLRELSLPLTWRVSNPTLGSISSSGGTMASYLRTTANGDNSIVVEDQYGARGVATVRQ